MFAKECGGQLKRRNEGSWAALSLTSECTSRPKRSIENNGEL